jgi:hypothetical protein
MLQGRRERRRRKNEVTEGRREGMGEGRMRFIEGRREGMGDGRGS